MKKNYIYKVIGIIFIGFSFFVNTAFAVIATITDFSPKEGKSGDVVTITGTNLAGATRILFPYFIPATEILTNTDTEITVKVPVGVKTSGTIEVRTPSSGSPTTSEKFIIIIEDPSNLPWWFKNNKTNIMMGPYDSIITCNDKKAEYLKTTPDLGDCIQKGENEVYNFDAQNTNTLKEGEYKLLAPIPGLKTAPNNFGEYINIMLKIAIGFCAVLAVIMIVIGGISYMGSESIFGKTEAKSQITKAILGLLIALGSYAILNTINPDFLNTNINIKSVYSEIKNFEISGGSTFDGKPIKINFNKEAYPAAKFAHGKTGIDIAFILAIFGQETGSGTDTGSCNYSNANMKPGQQQYLEKLATLLKMRYQDINMSCKAGASTYGGAIGLTQFLPETWLSYNNEAKQLLGHEPNPWVVKDALMMTALYLKSVGGLSNEKEAACKYFAGPNSSCGKSEGINEYGNGVMGRKLSIQQQIDEAIKKGEIEP